MSKYVRRITKIPSEGDDGEEEEEEYTEEDAKEELYVWEKFCGTVWDSLAKGVARNIVQFHEAVDKMWVQFVQPIAKGEYGTRNFSSLYLLQKDMFKRETSVIDSVLPPAAAGRTTAMKSEFDPYLEHSSTWIAADYFFIDVHDLPYYSKFLLCAAYLASYNPSRQDSLFFMKASDFSKKRRRGGGRGRPAKNRKVYFSDNLLLVIEVSIRPFLSLFDPIFVQFYYFLYRHANIKHLDQIHRRLLGPQAWPLERMLAIFYAILPHPIPSSVDIQTQVSAPPGTTC